MKCNGTTPVKIKSLNGIISFKEERFIIEDEEVRYFELTKALGINNLPIFFALSFLEHEKYRRN